MFVDDSKEEKSRMIQPGGMHFKIESLGFILFAFFLYRHESIRVRRSIF